MMYGVGIMLLILGIFMLVLTVNKFAVSRLWTIWYGLLLVLTGCAILLFAWGYPIFFCRDFSGYALISGMGLLFYSVAMMNIWKLVVCREKIMAEYTGCRTIHSFRGPDTFIPRFSYERGGEHYYDIEGGYGCSARKIKQYQRGEQYEVYIHPHSPQIIRTSQGIRGMDMLLLLLGTVFFIFSISFFLTACGKKESGTTDVLQGMSEENILYLSIEIHDEETDVEKQIDVYMDTQKLVINDMETALTAEQCRELRSLIYQYTYQVEVQKSDYWPQTEEYPDMRVLFCYRVWYGEERYSQSGALCYPDGWQQFIHTLEEYGKI